MPGSLLGAVPQFLQVPRPVTRLALRAEIPSEQKKLSELDRLEHLLETIPSVFQNTRMPESGFGAPVKVSYSILI